MGNFLKKGSKTPVRAYMLRRGKYFMHLVGVTKAGHQIFEAYESHYGAAMYRFNEALQVMKAFEETGETYEMVDAQSYIGKQKKDSSQNAVLMSPAEGLFLQFVDATENEDGSLTHQYEPTNDFRKARIFPRVAAEKFLQLAKESGNEQYKNLEMIDAIQAYKKYSK